MQFVQTQDLGKAYNDYKQGEPALERIFDLMRFNPEVLTNNRLLLVISLILPSWLNYKNSLEQVVSIFFYLKKCHVPYLTIFVWLR